MVKIHYSTLFYLKILVLLLAGIFSRPAILGGNNPEIGIALGIVALFIHIGELLLTRSTAIVLPHHNRIITLLVIILWLYLSLHAMILGSKNLATVFYGSLANIGIISVFAIVLGDRRTRIVFFRAFILILAAQALSYIVTLILTQRYGLSELQLFTISVKGYENLGTGQVCFPFTVIYSYVNFDGVIIPRLQSIFREAGIAQAFYAWAFITSETLWKRSTSIKAILMIGLISTISSIGMAIAPLYLFAIALRSSNLFQKQREGVQALVIIATLAMSWPIFYYTASNLPYVGLTNKAQYAEASISIRDDSISDGLRELMSHPLGIGLYNTEVGNFAAIHLIGESQFVGVPGILLVLLLYWYPLTTAVSRISYALAIGPLFLTALVSQPLLNAPLIYVMFLWNEPQNRQSTSIN